ncbi:hypothetical protein GCM10009132_12140 [Serratia ureilytica]
MGFVVSGYPQGFVLLIFFYLLKDLIQNLLKLDLNLIDLSNILLTYLYLYFSMGNCLFRVPSKLQR